MAKKCIPDPPRNAIRGGDNRRSQAGYMRRLHAAVNTRRLHAAARSEAERGDDGATEGRSP
eukprot:3100014-Prymnesium_polylepis.3